MSEHTIEYFRELAQDLTLQEFGDEFRAPFLLRRRLSRTLTPRGPGDFDDLGFNTDVVDLDTVPLRGRARLVGSKVVAIVKSDRNPFAGQISVGRAKNCDIVLRDGSVSKNHAYFRLIDGSSAELVDTHSQNCTRVNESPIKPVVPVRVTSGDRIAFGSVVTEFLDAAALYRLLEPLRG